MKWLITIVIGLLILENSIFTNAAKGGSYDKAIGEAAAHINKASERSREIQNEHMKNVDKDPSKLLTKKAMQSLMNSNSFKSQKAGSRSITLQANQGFNGITNYQPSGWKITETMSGPKKKKPETESAKEPIYSYPRGLGPVLMNMCTEKEYTESSPCYNSKLFDAKRTICKNMIDAAAYIGVGFDGRGFYSPVSRKVSLVQRVCAKKAQFMGEDIPDTMNVFGIFKTEAETKSFQSVDQYMKYIRHKAGLSNQKGLFTSEASKYKKSSSFGMNLGGIGALVGAGIGAVAGGPAGAAAGAKIGGAIGGSIEAGVGSGKGRSSSKDKGSSSSRYEQSDKSSTNQGASQNFFAIMFVKIVLYELTLDELEPTDLSLALLKDYIDLPKSYYSVGADVKFQNFVLRWGTHYIRSGKFGGQLKITKTMKTKTVMSSEQFASVAEKEFKSMFSTLQSSYSQKSSSWGILGIGGKSKSAKQKSKAKNKNENKSKSQAENKQSQKSSRSSFTQTSVEAEGGTPQIAEAIMDFYTPAFKQLFHEWLVSIKDHAKPFEFQLKTIYDIFDISMHKLFPAGNFKFGCNGAGKKNITIKTEAVTNKKFYMDTRVVKQGDSFVEEKVRVYCKYSHRKDFMKDMNRRRLALERAVGVYMVEGPFPTTSQELPAGQPGCEEKTLTKLNLYSHKDHVIKFSELKAVPFLLVFNLPQEIPGVTTPQAKYQMTYTSGRWFATKPGAKHVNLFEGCVIAGSRSSDYKICFRNIVLTYEPKNGFFHVEPRDFQVAKMRLPTLPQWLSGSTVARPKRLHGIKKIEKGLASGRVAVPCNVKWLNSHRLDPRRNENCIHFTAATEGDIFVLFASIPKKHHSWHYLQINSEGVRFYKGFKLEKSDNKLGMGILGDKNLFQSFFVCISQGKDKVTMQFGKADPDSEVGTVYSSFTYPSGSRYSRLSFYSFGSGDKDVSLMDIRTTKKLPKVRCLDDDYVKVDGKCMLVCHKECNGCSRAKDNKACHKCKNLQAEYGSAPAKVTVCISKCPAGKTPSSSKKGLCASCPAGTFKSGSGNGKCSPCAAGSFSASGASKCTLCSPGSYNNKEGQDKCAPCAAGTFSSNKGAKKCSPCAAGKFSLSGKSTCSPCAAGRYSSSRGSASCKACRAGFFAAKTGQTSCSKCPPGSASAAGSSSCNNNCKAGQFSPGKGSPCRDCPAGSYSPSAGSSSCKKCPKGRFQMSSGRTFCSKASKGSYVSAVGASRSSRCPAGTFSDFEGATSCKKCPYGTFASSLGSKTCTKCPANHFSNRLGASRCSKCPVTSYSAAGASTCRKCPELSADSTKHLCYKKLKISSCRQSSDLNSISQCTRAMDGSRAAQSRARCAITKSATNSEWTATFARPVKLSAVMIFAREENSQQSTNINVEAFDGKLWRMCKSVRDRFAKIVVLCRVSQATKLRIRRLTKDSLALCEVEAYSWTRDEVGSKCKPGQFASSIASATVCSSCPPGSVSRRSGETSCELCAPGYFSNRSGATSCSRCKGNSASSASRTSCSSCAALQFTNPSVGKCTRCPAIGSGSYNRYCYTQIKFSSCSQSNHKLTSSNVCRKAMDGSTSRSSSACSILKINSESEWQGKFSSPQTVSAVRLFSRSGREAAQSTNVNVEVYDGARWRVCGRITRIFSVATVDCRAKNVRAVRIVRRNVKQYLALCEVQAFALKVNDVSNSCGVGHFASKIGSATTCTKCPVGAYSTQTKSTTCDLCPAGSISNKQGSTSCSKCPIGHYSNSAGHGVCAKCPVGKYSNRVGANSCTSCPAGTFADKVGSKSCTNCPRNKYSKAGSQKCLTCKKRTYSYAKASSCRTCPSSPVRDRHITYKCFDYFPISLGSCRALSYRGRSVSCSSIFDGKANTCVRVRNSGNILTASRSDRPYITHIVLDKGDYHTQYIMVLIRGSRTLHRTFVFSGNRLVIGYSGRISSIAIYNIRSRPIRTLCGMVLFKRW